MKNESPSARESFCVLLVNRAAASAAFFMSVIGPVTNDDELDLRGEMRSRPEQGILNGGTPFRRGGAIHKWLARGEGTLSLIVYSCFILKRLLLKDLLKLGVKTFFFFFGIKGDSSAVSSF